MAILFLDFDGVLHPTPSEALFIHNGLLHRWLRAAPEVDVVFSTSRRSSFDFETLVECVAFEAPDLASRFVGAIPEVDRGALDRRAAAPDPQPGLPESAGSGSIPSDAVQQS